MKFQLTMKVIEGTEEEMVSLVEAMKVVFPGKISVLLDVSPALASVLRIKQREEAQPVIAVLNHAKRHLLDQKMEALFPQMSMRLRNCLPNYDLIYVGDVVKSTQDEMLRVPNMGNRTRLELKELLDVHGLTLGMDVGEWQPPKAA